MFDPYFESDWEQPPMDGEDVRALGLGLSISENKEDDVEPRYPEVEVQLTGSDGNAFAVLGKVRSALKLAGVRREEILLFTNEAMGGDYDELLATCIRWVTVN